MNVSCSAAGLASSHIMSGGGGGVTVHMNKCNMAQCVCMDIQILNLASSPGSPYLMLKKIGGVWGQSYNPHHFYLLLLLMLSNFQLFHLLCHYHKYIQ